VIRGKAASKWTMPDLLARVPAASLLARRRAAPLPLLQFRNPFGRLGFGEGLVHRLIGLIAERLQVSGVTQLVSDALGLVVHKQNLGN
jgi:hypothetical protein